MGALGAIMLAMKRKEQYVSVLLISTIHKVVFVYAQKMN